MTIIPDIVLDSLKGALGPDGWSQDPDRLAPKLTEWRGRWTGWTPLLALPRTTEQVSAVVRICADAGVPLAPQGGNTGLVGGQIPAGEVLLSTERLDRIRELNTADDVLEVEAGVTLADARQAAADAGRVFPLSLASEGSATIGGLVSTNAGGVQVLRHGSMRALVLGLEVVLPDGEVWDGLSRLRKDNTGYDLKQLFIGAEGTLGVVTAASLRLSPRPASTAVAIAAVESPSAAIRLLVRAKEASGDGIEGFELISALGMTLALRNLPGTRSPLRGDPPWYVLMETIGAEPDSAGALLERLLAHALDDGLISDASLAQNEAQARAFWALREGQSAAQKPEGPPWKHDVSVPISRIAEFIAETSRALTLRFPGVRIDAFGHLGDGNIHFDVLMPENGDSARHQSGRDEAARLVHDLVVSMGGSISAEHGLGVMKTAEAAAYKSATELRLARAVRSAIDPRRLMNPRVLF